MASSEVPWSGLHPASLLVNLVPRAWATLRSLWGPILLAFITGRQAYGQEIVDVFLVVTFFVLAIANTLIHFLTLRFRVAEGRLEIRSGLLNRQVRVISADRIQNLEMVRNVFHRMSGLVEVRIETASGSEVEGMLSALAEEHARGLISALEEARGESRATEEPVPAEVVLTNTWSELLWFGATDVRFGGTVVVLGFALEGILGRMVDPEDVRRTSGLLAGLGGLALIVAVVSGTWLVRTVTAVVQHYRFRLARSERALVAERGLLTTLRSELTLSKVQLVTVLEPWLRRLAGFSSVVIETAAAREGGDGTQRSSALVPHVAETELAPVLGSALPLRDLDPATVALQPPHPRALIRATAAGLSQTGILAAVATWWFWPWGALALILLPLSMLVARLDHRYQGWAVTDDLIVSRRGWWTRQTWWLARAKLQSTEVTQGPILRRYGLGVLHVRVAGSVVQLPAMTFDEALALQSRLLEREVAEASLDDGLATSEA